MLNEDDDRKYEDEDQKAHEAVCNNAKTAFKDLTGAEAGGPDKEGDTELDFDDEGKVVRKDDWWTNDDTED